MIKKNEKDVDLSNLCYKKQSCKDWIYIAFKIKNMKNIIIASTSTVHGSGYLEYLLPELKTFFKGIN